MRAVKRPHHFRHHRAIIRHARHRDALRWLAHEYEDDEEVIVGPGNDRADGEGQA